MNQNDRDTAVSAKASAEKIREFIKNTLDIVNS